MSEGAQRPEVDRSYGELLGEYFAVVSDIAPMLDEFGRPEPEYLIEYSQLKTRKVNLQEVLERKAPDHEKTEIESILDDAFSDL